MRTIEVCLSPALIGCYSLQGKTAVVIDVLRATSAMAAALASGVKAIRPVATVDECLEWVAQGYEGAAEREGQVVAGFSIGNSPLAFIKAGYQDALVALTTTNGTKAMKLSHDAAEIIAGAFVNLEAVVQYLQRGERSVVLVCAGWKDNFNLEDTLFAGAVVHALTPSFEKADDASLASEALYLQHATNLMGAIEQSSHFRRLAKLGIEDDIRFCMQTNHFDLVPVLKDGLLIAER